jgi:hypothetical protein
MQSIFSLKNGSSIQVPKRFHFGSDWTKGVSSCPPTLGNFEGNPACETDSPYLTSSIGGVSFTRGRDQWSEVLEDKS